MRPRRGFTLIELLVVIAIIVILASILFPVFARMREKGRQTQCVSNLRQLGIGLTMYRADFDEQNPGSADCAHCPGQFSSAWPPWMRGFVQRPEGQWVPCYWIPSREWDHTGVKAGALFPYVKNEQVYRCPSDWRDNKRLSYSMNAVAGYIPDAKVTRASRFAVLVDEQETLNDGFYRARYDCPTLAHNEGVTMVFFDGHSRWFRAIKQPVIGRCSYSVRMHLFCPYLPFNEALEYLDFCQRED